MKRTIALPAVLLMTVLLAHGINAGETAPGDLLPVEKDLDGWKKDGEALLYRPDNLWEYINGQAESFLMYDFHEVAAQHYLDGSGLEIKVEIYGHGDPLMAFGIYTQFRSPENAFLDIGNEAFGDEYSLHFWKGRFYVKVYAYEEGEKSSEAMKMFAGLVAGTIPEEGGEPHMVSLFPRDGLIEKSVVYITEGVMGSGKLPPVFTGDYLIGEEKGRLYLFRLDSEDAAAETFSWYAGEIGAAPEKAVSNGAEYSVADGEAPYRGAVKVFRYGIFMGIVTGFPADSGSAGKISGEFLEMVAGSEGK